MCLILRTTDTGRESTVGKFEFVIVVVFELVLVFVFVFVLRQSASFYGLQILVEKARWANLYLYLYLYSDKAPHTTD